MTSSPPLSGRGPVAGLTILVVEDLFLMADEAQDLLFAGGAKAVALAADVAEALEHMASTRFDVAVVDINLSRESGLKLGEELQRRGIPFIFSTGYGREALNMPSGLTAVPLLSKPYTAELLVETLGKALAAHDEGKDGS